ncbi:MAG: hypothetical protein H6727_12210 [Myxococcales bacterium]|nr:hypothetical protein [Myxococcales bacterium]
MRDLLCVFVLLSGCFFPCEGWARPSRPVSSAFWGGGSFSETPDLSMRWGGVLLGEEATRPFQAKRILGHRALFDVWGDAPASVCSMDGAAWKGCAAKTTKANNKKQDNEPKEALPSEWPLALLMGFSGVIVSVVVSYVSQAVIEAAMVSPSSPTVESRLNASLAYTSINIALIPWVVAGTMYGLSRLSNNYRSNFWWMLLGAYIGQVTSAGIGLLATFLGSGTERFTVARIVTLFADGLLAAAGALLAYLLVRKPYEEVETLGTLIHYKDGKMRWGVPLPMVTREGNDQRVMVSLFAGRF